MSTQTYTNTTASAILTMAAADCVTMDLSSLTISETVSASGVREMVGGGSRETTYSVTRVDDECCGCTRTVAV